MKKRIFSILTALCLCLTLLQGMAFAEDGAVTEAKTTAELTDALAGTAETIQLTANIDINATLEVSRTVTLDLNDHVLRMTASGSVIYITDKGSLTLTDSAETKTEKKFSVTDGLWVLDETNSTKTVKGGVITGGTGVSSGNYTYGGGVYVARNGTFTMNGGSIAGCAVQATNDSVYGGGVYVAEDGKFTMTGGSITGCTAVGAPSHGGGIHNEGTATLSGTAEIRDCHAKAGTDNYAYGGGVHDADGIFKISGDVKIIGCTAVGKESSTIKSDAMNIGAYGAISGGTFDGSVYNGGTISGGTFNDPVSNNSSGKITAGTFNGAVENYGTITGGTFTGGVTGNGSISEATVVAEVKTAEEFLTALADPNVTTIKLMKNDIKVEAGTVLTVDRSVTLVAGDRAPELTLERPLTIAGGGALTLGKGVHLNPCDSVVVNGELTVGAGGEAIFDTDKSSLTINQSGTVTTQPAGENTTSGLLSLGQGAKLTVDGTLVNNGRLYVSDMENLKKAAGIGGELILDSITITENYTLDQKGNPLTIEGSLNFADGANLTVRNASKVEATGVTITGGSYYCPVTVGDNEGRITGGSFYGPVTVRKQQGKQPAPIFGGTFYDKLEGDYSIEGRTVTYMDGEDVYAIQVVGGKATAPDTPVRSGYRFAGWYDGDAKWNFDTVVTDNLTLTAKWDRIHTSAPSTPRYDVAVSDGAHGSVTVSPKNASKGSTVTVTVTPDKGYALETLTVIDKNGNALDLTDKGGGKYTFTMPSGPVTVAATFMDDNTMLNFFVDVPAGSYYYDAVLWAAEGGIAAGTDAVHFSPDATCTRAQLVTFLWRAAGKPVVNYAMNFNDVDEGTYYAEAVRWAASEKIVEGTTATTFAPDAVVTRAQVVTMLYRFAKAQGMDTTQGGMAIREFDDFDAVPAYALEAMDWAVNAGVLKGDNNRLLPQNACTRAQIVTLLWRACSK